MSSNSDASAVSRADIAVTEKKKMNFESAMVNVGSLVVYLAASGAKKTARALKKAAVRVIMALEPRGGYIKAAAAKRFGKIRRKIAKTLENDLMKRRRLAERISEHGFARAVLMSVSEASRSRSGRRFFGTIVNHAVPAACAVALICVVSDKVSADYGVMVEYNGQEIGVVSEEAVLDSAQEVIADRASYFDTGSDTYINATLTLKPLGAQEEVVNEQTLADAIQEQIDIQAPAEEDVAEPAAQTEPVNAGFNLYGGTDEQTEEAEPEDEVFEAGDKERAFVVTVDGEMIGAVREYEDIEKFLEETKDAYLDDTVESVAFDKEIEYTYEQYVDPSEIVNEQDIIDKLDSNIEEPVYYEIQEGDNPWNIARANGMTTDELKNCFITFDGERIDDITQYCPIGAIVQLSEEVPYLQVLTTKEVSYTEVIDYEIIKTEDPDMYKGDTAVDVKGIEGEKQVTALVTYRGGTKVSAEIIDEVVLSEPVTKYMRVGTRETTTPVSTGSGGSGEYFWPVDGGYISAYQGDGRGHKGIDIAAPYGTPIYAAESGTVIETGSGWNGGYGNCVRIQHDDGNITVYAHQSSIAISYGDYVVKGQLIGYVGSTGDSTGNHLHFEVRSYGTYANPLNYVSQ